MSTSLPRLILVLLALGVAGCTGGEPKAPVTADKVWKTLHPEQWDIDPNTVTVPAMPKGAT